MFFVGLSPATRDFTADAQPELYDAYDVLVMEACEQLEQTDCSFRVSGFGQEWPVDVGYDLSTFMEEFPELLAAVRGGETGTVDLYGQGVERSLTFRPEGEKVRVTCESRTDWVPDPDTEWVGRGELEDMLVSLAVDFAASLGRISASLAAREPFASWRRGEV